MGGAASPMKGVTERVHRFFSEGAPRVTQECRISLATDLEKVGFGFVLVGRAFGFSI